MENTHRCIFLLCPAKNVANALLKTILCPVSTYLHPGAGNARHLVYGGVVIRGVTKVAQMPHRVGVYPSLSAVVFHGMSMALHGVSMASVSFQRMEMQNLLQNIIALTATWWPLVSLS